MRWQLVADPEYKLVNEAGERRMLPYRKVAELLVALAKSKGRPVERDQLSFQLWPSSPRDVRLTNLRQALKGLRQAIGPSLVSSGKTHCELAKDFELVLPQGSQGTPHSKEPVHGFEVFLDHLSYSSPIQFFETIRVNADFALNISPNALGSLVRRAAGTLPSRPDLTGWAHYFNGVSTMGNLVTSKRHFGQSLKAAKLTQDFDLYQRTVHWLGACMILQGRTDFALSLAVEAERGVGQAQLNRCQWIASLKGTSYLHAGMFRESAETLLQLSYSRYQSQEEWRQHEALRAFYLASTGDYSAASVVSSDLGADTNGLTYDRATMLRFLTTSLIQIRTEARFESSALAHWTRGAADKGQDHLLLYGLETLALAQAKEGDEAAARQTLRESMDLRQKLGTVKTLWDHHRLRAVHQALAHR
ncbi:MAG TPA: hypothetical protein VG944_20180 [Fimbriimonas sp.]|nr:hypothetical protein [Fimbriimonas sp.]